MRHQRLQDTIRITGSICSAIEAMRADYDMAKESRFRRRLTGYSPMGSGADYHYRSEADFLKMMELARAMDRNDVIIGQGVTRLVDNVIQGGMRIDPDTGDDGADAVLKTKWRQWSENPDLCDASGEMTFCEIAEKALRAAIVDGDQFFIPLESGQLQVMEAHRCRTPNGTKRNVVHGVLLEPGTRKRLEYWFTNEDVSPMSVVSKVADITPIPARDKRGNRMVFHLHLSSRASQTRGVSAFAPVVNAIGMHDDIQFAKLVQQQMVSMFAILRNRSVDGNYGVNPAMGASEEQTLDDGTTRTMTELAPGMELTSQPGETITGFSPNIPNAEYFEHVKMILTFIAVNLGIPRHVLLLDPSDTNFSGWRGAIDQARLGFQRLQRRMIDRFYCPVYRWKVRQWAVQDKEVRTLAALYGDKIFNHYWTPPYWQYIEPLKDAQADKEIIENRLNSRREQLAKRGLDIDEVDRDAAADQARWIRICLKAAQEITNEFPDAGVTWRDIAAQSGPVPVNANTTTDSADEIQPQKNSKNAGK